MTIALRSPKLTRPDDLSTHLRHPNLSRTRLNPRNIVANGEERHGKHFLLAGGSKTRGDEGRRHHWSWNVAQIVRRTHQSRAEVQKLLMRMSGKRSTGSTSASMFQGGKFNIYGKHTAPTNGGLTRSAMSGI